MSLLSAQPRRVLSAPIVSDLVTELAMTKRQLATAQAELAELRGSPLLPGLQIRAEVARKHGLTLMGMLKPRTGASEVAARDEAIWRMYHETGLSLPQIGKVVNRDRTTILYSLRKTAAATGRPSISLENWPDDHTAALTAFLAGVIDLAEAQKRTGKKRLQLLRRARQLGLDTSTVLLGPAPRRWSRHEMSLASAFLAGTIERSELILRLPGRGRSAIACKLRKLRGDRP